MTDVVDDLITEIADVGENESSQVDEIKVKREALKLAAATGEIDRSVKGVERLTARAVESAYEEWEKLKHLRRQTFLCDLVLNRLAQVLGYIGAVNDTEALKTDLKEDQLLSNDISRIISYVEPYVPFVGLLSGSLTVASHALVGRAKLEPETAPEMEQESN